MLATEQLFSWLNSPNTKVLLEVEDRLLDDRLTTLGVEQCLYCGLRQDSSVPYSFATDVLRIGSVGTQGYIPADAQLICDITDLPLTSGSMDLVVLHHLHECYRDINRVLTEAVRVLAPRGHLVCIGFNPWWPQGALRVVKRCLRIKNPITVITAGRLSHKIRLQGCAIDNIIYGSVHFSTTLWGSVYMVHAVKETYQRINEKTAHYTFKPTKMRLLNPQQ